MPIGRLGIGCLANLANGDDSCLKVMAAAGGGTAVVATLRAHGQDPELAADGCLALANMAATRFSLAVRAVIDAGGIPAVVRALQMHGKAAPRVRQWGLAAITNLTKASPDARDAVSDADVLPAVVATLGACTPVELEARQLGCLALDGLASVAARDGVGARAVSNAGGAEAVVKAMGCATEDPSAAARRLLEAGCRSLARLAFSSPREHETVRAAGAAPLLRALLARGEEERELRGMAGTLLQKLGGT